MQMCQMQSPPPGRDGTNQQRQQRVSAKSLPESLITLKEMLQTLQKHSTKVSVLRRRPIISVSYGLYER